MVKKLVVLSSLIGSLVLGLVGCGSTSIDSSSEYVSSDSYASGSTSDYSYDDSFNGINSSIEYEKSAAKGFENVEAGETGDSFNKTSTESDTDSKDSNENENIVLLEEKLIYRSNISIETLDYADSLSKIKEIIENYGGIIQSEYERDGDSNWYYREHEKTRGTLANTLSVRVRSDKFKEFTESIGDCGKVISKNSSTENISNQYYDTKSEIEALKIQEQKLLSMLENCETIEEMLTVDERLSNVQYSLSRLQTEIRYMDMDVAYSYVTIELQEVKEYVAYEETVSYWEEFGKEFLDAIEDAGYLVIELIAFMIHLIPIVIIIIIPCVLILKALIRLFKGNRNKPEGSKSKKRWLVIIREKIASIFKK